MEFLLAIPIVILSYLAWKSTTYVSASGYGAAVSLLGTISILRPGRSFLWPVLQRRVRVRGHDYELLKAHRHYVSVEGTGITTDEFRFTVGVTAFVTPLDNESVFREVHACNETFEEIADRCLETKIRRCVSEIQFGSLDLRDVSAELKRKMEVSIEDVEAGDRVSVSNLVIRSARVSVDLMEVGRRDLAIHCLEAATCDSVSVELAKTLSSVREGSARGGCSVREYQVSVNSPSFRVNVMLSPLNTYDDDDTE
jgi:hypothetical protein